MLLAHAEASKVVLEAAPIAARTGEVMPLIGSSWGDIGFCEGELEGCALLCEVHRQFSLDNRVQQSLAFGQLPANYTHILTRLSIVLWPPFLCLSAPL